MDAGPHYLSCHELRAVSNPEFTHTPDNMLLPGYKDYVLTQETFGEERGSEDSGRRVIKAMLGRQESQMVLVRFRLLGSSQASMEEFVHGVRVSGCLTLAGSGRM